MHINLPDRIPTEDLNGDLACVLKELLEDGVVSVGELRITLKAFNADDREYYPPDETGHHNMGFTLKRPASPGPDHDLREVSWTYHEPRPQPKVPPSSEMRGLRGLLDEAAKRGGE